jgi:hypothetical protein
MVSTISTTLSNDTRRLLLQQRNPIVHRIVLQPAALSSTMFHTSELSRCRALRRSLSPFCNGLLILRVMALVLGSLFHLFPKRAVILIHNADI